MIKLAFVIPYYNEYKNLEYLINEWNKYLKKEQKLLSQYKIKFFFINDGSTDSSNETIQNNNKKFDSMIINKKNSGHGDSCIFAYEYILKMNYYDYILQIDSDNQCNPEYLKNFLNLTPDCNFVFGHRKKRMDGFLRLISTKILSILVFLITKKKIYDLNVPYRLMKCCSLKKYLKKVPNTVMLKNAYLTYIISKSDSIVWIPIVFRERYFGSSFFNANSMLKYLINLIINIYSNEK